MVDLISSVDALFSYYGATLFALGLLCSLIPRTFKFGVLTLILADIPLALAIAFPRKVIETLNGWGFAPENFPDPQTGHTYGIVSGIATFVVLFALRTLLKSLCAKRKSEQDKAAVGDDEPIELSEDDPSGVSDDKKGLFKGLKGKKSPQRASALHLNSDDNPLNLADTKALKKSEELQDKGDLVHESFSLEPMGTTSDDVKEPTLSSDVFTNHMSHDEPHFSNSFIDNAAHGSINHDYQGTLELSTRSQNPLIKDTEQQNANWSGLFAKINQAQQQQQQSTDLKLQAAPAPQNSKRIDQVELDTFSLAGNKVSDVLEVMDDPKLSPELLNKHQEAPKKDENHDNFAQILSSAQEQQNDYASLEPDPDYISEEQLAFAALEQSHKTVAQALADLEAQEQEPKLSDKEREDLVSKSHMSSPQVLQDNLQARSLEVVEPSKISYLYSDPVHEDVSEGENEPQEDILERYEGDSTNYSFSIKGVFKEKRPLSVAGFVDRASYLEQSQFEANFHEKELEHMVKPDEHVDPQEELKLKREQILAMARQVAEQMDAELDAKKVQALANISADEAQALASLFDDEPPKTLSGVTSISANSGDLYLQSTQTHTSSLDNTEPLELKADLDSEVLLSDQEPSAIDSLQLQKSKQDVREANVSKTPPVTEIKEPSHVQNASRSLKLSKVEFLPEPQIAGEIQSAATAAKPSASQTEQNLVSKTTKLPSANQEKLSIGRALFNKLRPNKAATQVSPSTSEIKTEHLAEQQSTTKSAPAPVLQGESKLSLISKLGQAATQIVQSSTKAPAITKPDTNDTKSVKAPESALAKSADAKSTVKSSEATTTNEASKSTAVEPKSKAAISKSSETKEQLAQATAKSTVKSSEAINETSKSTAVEPKSKAAISKSSDSKASALSKSTKEQLAQATAKSTVKSSEATATIEVSKSTAAEPKSKAVISKSSETKEQLTQATAKSTVKSSEATTNETSKNAAAEPKSKAAISKSSETKEQLAQTSAKSTVKSSEATTSEVSKSAAVEPKSKAAISKSSESKASSLSKSTKEQLAQATAKSTVKSLETTNNETSKSTAAEPKSKVAISKSSESKASALSKSAKEQLVQATAKKAVKSSEATATSEVSKSAAVEPKSKAAISKSSESKASALSKSTKEQLPQSSAKSTAVEPKNKAAISKSSESKVSALSNSTKEQLAQASAKSTVKSLEASTTSEVSKSATVEPKSKAAISKSSETKESALSKLKTKLAPKSAVKASAAAATTTTTTAKVKSVDLNKVSTTKSTELSGVANTNSELKGAGALQTKSKRQTEPQLSTISEVVESPKASLKNKRRIGKKVSDEAVIVQPSAQELNQALAKDAALAAFSSLADVDELEALVKDSCAVKITAPKVERKSASLKKSLRRTKH